MNFEQAQQEYLRLKTSYENGEMTPEQYERAVLNLRMVDGEGQAWQIGLTSGAWYRRQGSQWVEDTPAAGGTAVRADRTFFGAPLWLSLAVGGASVLTVLGVFVVSMFFLLNSGAFPIARVITATPGPTDTPGSVTPTRTNTSTASLTPTVEEGTPAPISLVTDFPTSDGEVTRTPSPVSTRNPSIPTKTSQPSANLPGVTPTRTRTPAPPNPDVVNRVWKSFSYTKFESMDAIQGEWLWVIDPDVYQFDFLNYKNRNGMLLTASNSFIEINPGDDSYNEPLDIEIEETFAFPTNNDTASIDFICRNNGEWLDYYFVDISRTKWYLDKYLDGEDITLAQGNTPSGFQGGDWGRLTMRCNANQISVWLNGILLSNQVDDSVKIGTWVIDLNMDDETDTSLYFASHRIYKGSEDKVGEELDRYQLGDLYATLDRGLLKEGDLYSLALSLENRSDQSREITANQIYLLGANGTRYTAAIDPPQNINLPPLRFPLTLNKQQMSSGSVYFRGLDQAAVSDGLDFVVDLSDFGLGQARFSLPPP